MIEKLSDAKLRRLERRIWKRINEIDGYQPFGYDWPTISLTHPYKAKWLKRIRAEFNRRTKQKRENLGKQLHGVFQNYQSSDEQWAMVAMLIDLRRIAKIEQIDFDTAIIESDGAVQSLETLSPGSMSKL